jgi:hypothetical protein
MRITSAFLAVCCCLSLSVAEAVQPHFSPSDVVQRVSAARATDRDHGPSVSRLDDGEFLVDTGVTYVSAPDDQMRSAVAYDGEDFLVVWVDWRGHHICGARVTPQGTLPDPAGVVISYAACDDEAPDPAVAFGGSEFLAVWTEDHDGRIHGARVSPQGVVLDSAGIAISHAAASQCLPAVVSDGANFLVVWQDYRDGSGYDNIYGARVTQQGAVLDTAGIVISRATHVQCNPAVGFDGTNFLVAWEDYRNGHDANIYGARVTSAGTVLDTAGFIILRGANDQCSPDLAFDGANFLVVSEDWDSGGDIHGARVTPAGMVLDTAGFVISHGVDYQDAPAVAFDGANFLVAWEDRDTVDHIHGARVTPAGTVLDTAGVVISPAEGGQYRPAIAYGGASYLATWDSYHDGEEDVRGARVAPTGTVLDSAGVEISQAANGQQSPALAFDGTNFLVAWQDYRDGSGFTDIYGTRVSPQGAILDSTSFVISHAANDQRDPALAFDGANFLVVWDDGRDGGDWDIFGARVTPQGQVLDTAGVAISRSAYAHCFPALAFDGTNFFVVWYERLYGGLTDIQGARVTPQGAVLDTAGIAISQSQDNEYYPAIASDGTNLLAVWSDWRGGGGNVYGARVTPQGQVLDTAGFDISRAPSGASSPDLCFDGTNYLAIWDDGRTLVRTDIYGARVSPQGAMLDSASFAITQSPGGRFSPSVAFDGTNSLVVWRDVRSGEDPEIYGARVTPGGGVFGGGSIISNQGNQMYPRVCCGSGGEMFLVYQDWAGTLGGKTYNAERVWGMMDPNPGIAEMTKPGVRLTNRGATIIRGALYLPLASSVEHRASSTLLDISGRKVLDLKPGANDVRALAPGVYFVREAQAQAQAVRKVIISK